MNGQTINIIIIETNVFLYSFIVPPLWYFYANEKHKYSSLIFLMKLNNMLFSLQEYNMTVEKLKKYP